MTRRILINALDSDECRIVTLNENKLEEVHLETAAREVTQGNIYKASIVRVEPSLQAVFVDYGAQKNGFLQLNEIHSDYFMDNDAGDRKITNLVKKGQELIVQVTKDPIMHKGAMLTTFISLPGRLCVLMPGSTTRGISRQISEEGERKRLKSIIDKVKLPEGFGLIVRTAGRDALKTMINTDTQYLLRAWNNINQKAIDSPTPALLYKEQNLAVRSLRDYYTDNITEILIDDPEVFKEVRDFMAMIAPDQKNLVKKFRGKKPIFSKYQIEEQIANIFEPKVSLKSGGAIVIDQTEALVAIDVNSGKSTSRKNIEQTAFHTNIEAAEEVARQLRLRDLGGLIVVDFIDMREKKHKAEVTKTLKKHLKTDKAKTKVGGISKFGLVEMSRQRLRPAITFGNHEPCAHCNGKGMLPSVETMGLSILRQLTLKTTKQNIHALRVELPRDVADFLVNKKRKELFDIEHNRNVTITVVSDSDLIRDDFRISTDG